MEKGVLSWLSLIWGLLKWGKLKWMGWIYQQFSDLHLCLPAFLPSFAPSTLFSSSSLLSFLPPSLCFPLSSPIHSFLKGVHWVKTVTVKLKKGKGGYIFRVSGFKVSVWIQHIYKSLVVTPGLHFNILLNVWLGWKKNYIVIHMDDLKLNKQYK